MVLNRYYVIDIFRIYKFYSTQKNKDVIKV